MVWAAHRTFALALGNGRVRKDFRPGLITLIQTHGDELNWNTHLHLLAADGAFDTRDRIVFHPMGFWDLPKMTQIFRFTLISRLHEAGVLSDDTATNLMSWPHSGFHVHHSDPFPASDREQLIRRLAYAFRTPVSLSQLRSSPTSVQLRTRKGKTLAFSPVEFLAHLTVHIPDRYQHYRRYAGLYASATRRFLGLETKAQVQRISEKPLTPRWATLLARIFGHLPIECPHCHQEMKLLGFVTHPAEIEILVPQASRAPPPKPVASFFDVHGKTPFLVAAEESAPYETMDFNQVREESDADFDQRIAR
ncbi:MAG TPA: transposase [Bdellovibrionota bacterium]|nr:transposase [Bdellovibrionota bacterium]